MSVEEEARKILLDLGLWWPEADSGKLRSAATAWRTFADAVDDVRGPVQQSASSIIHHNTGESIEAFGKFWGRYAKDKDSGWLKDLADSGREMAKALDKFADAIDDAINKLWTQIGIDAAVIAGGVALAFFTAGLASGAAVAAADLVIEFGAGLGVAVSTTIAEIAGGTLVAAAFGGIESVTVDLAVAQPLKIATGLQQGFSLDEVNQAAKDGMIFGGALGAGSGVLKAGVEGAFSDTTPLLLRPPSLRPDLVELGPAARNADRTPCVGEPIDVATGAMLMTATDLVLPGSLPLEFTRTHLSSYRGGVCFGPAWISTLDECLQIDGEGVVFAASDGMRLVYPIPEPGVSTLPVKGARWPLEWDGKPDSAMTVTDPATGVVRTFGAPAPSPAFGVFHLALDSWSDRNGNRNMDDTPFPGTTYPYGSLRPLPADREYTFDQRRGIIGGPYLEELADRRRRFTLRQDLSAFVPDYWGSHDLKLGFVLERENFDRRTESRARASLGRHLARGRIARAVSPKAYNATTIVS